MPLAFWSWTIPLAVKTSSFWGFQRVVALRSLPSIFGTPWPPLPSFTLMEMQLILAKCTSFSSNSASICVSISLGTSSLSTLLSILEDFVHTCEIWSCFCVWIGETKMSFRYPFLCLCGNLKFLWVKVMGDSGSASALLGL